MNVNIYLENSLGSQLNQLSKATGKTRNLIIREAIQEWIVHHTKQWPESVMKFQGVKDFPPFEENRDQLKPPKDDPFA